MPKTKREGSARSARVVAPFVGQLAEAIETGGLFVYYQPKIDLRSGTVDSLEALVRWRHPRRGLLRPDAFLPLAERMGVMPKLTRWVLDESLRQCKAFVGSGQDLSVAVNVSPRLIQADARLPHVVEGLLERHEVDPRRLILEITETALIGNPDHAVKVMTVLSDMGVRLALDDFGTGYSSLSLLQHLPLDEIKIDVSFVRAMARNPVAAQIVKYTVDLGHGLGLVTTAEGVEDDWTLATLMSQGVDAVQGYLFARPLPADRLARRWIALGEQASRATRRRARGAGAPRRIRL